MANHKSAKKRAIQNEKKRARNMAVKTQMKNAVKAVRSAEADKAENMTDTLIKATSVIDVAAKKGVIHKNTAARKISRLTKLVNGVKA
ncbi:30S ribosomal protein S20 [Desulfoluna limicola]|uniref:Small ribosomal subunit protein bS20 n=1 Tax=Desulfoluna limicola TaxID=2810562 RepID=A0ABN6F0T0_9BACT|nr:30S ribosomal protein S20 [Desulfoluna limicola]BCS96132.1 30S ribosomal protein S20 [Desulfoluna limicola]